VPLIALKKLEIAVVLPPLSKKKLLGFTTFPNMSKNLPHPPKGEQGIADNSGYEPAGPRPLSI
jgi:hypothetical protein